MDSNPINKIVLKNMPMLYEVSLLSTQISLMQELDIPKSVQRIFMSNNQISSADFINWRNLTTLVIQSNQLTNTTTFENLPQLREFWMDYNQLNEVTFNNVPKI